jgi:hypothetical protein
MFSDKSTFRPVRRSSTMSHYKQKFIATNVKHSPSVMVWGCFSARKGRGSLFFLPPKMTMNSFMYMSMLREKPFPWMAIHGMSKFLQDGAPCHPSKVSMALLREQPFTVMDWPGNSPDLNPIENVRSIMKARLKSNHTITSLPKLERGIKTMCVRDLPLSLFQNLAHSMPTRIKIGRSVGREG